MFIFFGSLIVFGVLAYMTWGTWWSLLFFLIYGNIWNCADPIAPAMARIKPNLDKDPEFLIYF